ncbi:MAG: hypothetical protein IJM18_06305 [Clostridia bacterium]|nr:hypothetical protein [Clostridia bacterium]
MKKKPIFYSELAYVSGLIILALGTAFMERADLGISMVVAPAYLIHLKLVRIWPFYSFGMSEYVFQAFLLILLSAIMKRFKKGYLFSFATAVLYGFTLDGLMRLAALIPIPGLGARIALYAVGILLCSLGVALFFHTYVTPEAYELFVNELAGKLKAPISRVKTVYDIVSCLIGVALSFAFFGLWHFEGVKLGTIVCALVNGPIIGLISKGLESAFEFRDGLKLRKLFTE